MHECYVDFGGMFAGARPSTQDTRRNQATEIFHAMDGWEVVSLSCCHVVLLIDSYDKLPDTAG